MENKREQKEHIMASQLPDIPSSNPETYYDIAGYLAGRVAEESTISGKIRAGIGALSQYAGILEKANDIANSDWPDDFKDAAFFILLVSEFGGDIFLLDFLEQAAMDNLESALNILQLYEEAFTLFVEQYPDLIHITDTGGIGFPWNPEDEPVSELPPEDLIKDPATPVNTDDPNLDKTPDEEKPADYNATKELSDPLILDLDGNGIDLAAVDSNGAVYWDIDNDGFTEASAWVSGNDGLLAIDLNGDGIINDHSELFGTETTDGFSVLSAYDNNGDGVIDVNDTQFGDLIVWVDANSDGYSDASELSSLSDLGITSINLNATLVDYEVAGNPITHESTFTINGQQQIIANAQLQYDNMNSMYNGDYTFDARVLDLPTLRGFGDIPDLFISMSLDETLLLMVQDLVSVDVNQMMVSSYGLQSKIEDVLYRWAGVDNVDPDSRPHIDGVSYIDARKLEFLEDYIGNEFEQEGRSNPNYDAADALELIFNSIVTDSLSAISSQSGGSSFYGQDASYNYINGEVIGSEDVDYIIFNDPLVAETMYGSDRNDAYLWSVGDGNDQIIETDGANDVLWLTGGVTEEDVRLEVYQSNDLRVNIGAESILITNQFYSEQNNTAHDFYKVEELVLEDGTRIDLTNNITFTGTDNADSINGITLNDTLVGGLGNDSLYGKEGDDSYVWSVGDGNDTIVEADGVDQLVLHNVILSDIRLEAQWGYNLKVHIGGEFITINNQFYTDFSGSSYYDLYQVESLLLDDGTQLDLLNNLTFSGTDNSESINGLTMDDILIGGLGNDTLSGGAGDDTYVYALGDGNDIISETAGSDVIEFGAGITFADLAFTQNGNNLLIAISDGSTIQVSNYYAYAGASIYGVEELRFDDGSVVDLQVLLNIAPVAVDDSFIGDQDVVVTGNVLSNNGNGADSDPEGNALTVVAGTYATANGSVTILANGDFTYTPNAAYNGADSFAYTIDDGFGGNDTASVNLTVRPPNVAPVAQDDAFTGNQDANLTGDLLANNGGGADSDPDGDPLSVVAGTYATTNGSVVITSSGSFTYTPNVGYVGADSFTYTLQDDRGGSDTGTANITLNAASQNGIYGTSSNDTLNGDPNGVSNDTLIGYGGNDTLNGKLGSDSYEWSVGDGNDTINETGGVDQLVLHNVLESDIRIEKSGTYNLKINIGSEYITVNSQYMSDYYNSTGYDQYQVESILLDDSTVIDLTTYNTLVGTSSNNSITGFNAATTFSGEAGNDTLYGKANGDTYVWDVGDGNDTINETGGIDQLVLHNVLESDIRIEKSGTYNLKINIGSEYITVNSQYMSDYYNSTGYDQYQVESILLDDSTVIDLTTYNTLVGTSGNNSITGFNAATTFIGEAGNDTLYGKTNGDTYVWDVGDGNDTINETGGVDQLVLHNVLESDIRIEKSGTYNLKINIGSEYITVNSQYMSDYYNSTGYDQYQVESILLDDSTVIDLTTYATLVGTSGNNSITGFNAATTFIGEAGNDTLYGKANGDTYVWDVGDGNDTINETGGIDQLVLHNVLESDIRLEVSGTYNLKIHVGSEYITVNSQYMSDYYNSTGYDQYQVESILLDDSTTIDLLNNLTFAGTSSNETINGLNGSDILSGLDGNDTLNAKDGDDSLFGGNGSDYLYGNGGDDVLYGGAGIDMLYGNAGADTFVLDDLSYSDNIQDFDLTAGDKLDVSDLLIGYDPLTDAITDFVQITESGSNSYLNVDADGGADNFVQVAYIYNETGLTDEDALETSGNLIAA